MISILDYFQKHPATNLLSAKNEFKKWLCKNPGDDEVSIIIQVARKRGPTGTRNYQTDVNKCCLLFVQFSLKKLSKYQVFTLATVIVRLSRF